MRVGSLTRAARLPACAGASLFLLGGCALLEDNVQNVFASRTTASAVVSGRLLQGQVSWIQGRIGQIHLESEDKPLLACAGSLQMTATVSGVATMRCSNNQTAMVPFALHGPLRAAGRGRMGDSEFLLTYGFPPAIAAPYLGVAIERLLPPPEPEVAKPPPAAVKPATSG